jgi:meiosis-specific transcription factor NDT80
LLGLTPTRGVWRTPSLSQPRYPRTVSIPYARSLFHTQSTDHGSNMSSVVSADYPNGTNESSMFPWPELSVVAEITCDGFSVTPDIHCKVEKGFFRSKEEDKWTCYRRNYFAVTSCYSIHCNSPNLNAPLFVMHEGVRKQIRALGIRMVAVVDGMNGKTIELIMHTPKRDAGPKLTIDMVKLWPQQLKSSQGDRPMPVAGMVSVPMSGFQASGSMQPLNLPCQTIIDAVASSSALSPGPQMSDGAVPQVASQHTFERIQFKQATANNGKRRASQQYFHLVVELHGDIREPGAPQPKWIKLASRTSEKVVVRGRSPSHYQEAGFGQGGRGGGSAAGGTYSVAPGQTFGHLNAGPYRGVVPGMYGSGYTATPRGDYRASHAALQSASEVSSETSGDSADESSNKPISSMDAIISHTDRSALQHPNNYMYYPSSIHETLQGHYSLPSLGAIDQRPASHRDPTVKSEYSSAESDIRWHSSGRTQFQGADSSRGYYTDLTMTNS